MIIRKYREDFTAQEWHELVTEHHEDVPVLFEDCIDTTGNFLPDFEDTLGLDVLEIETDSFNYDNIIIHDQRTGEDVAISETPCPHCTGINTEKTPILAKWQRAKFLKKNFADVIISHVDLSDLMLCNDCKVHFVPLSNFGADSQLAFIDEKEQLFNKTLLEKV